MFLGSYPASAIMAMYPEAPACPVLAQSSATIRNAMHVSSVCMSIIAHAVGRVGRQYRTRHWLSVRLEARVYNPCRGAFAHTSIRFAYCNLSAAHALPGNAIGPSAAAATVGMLNSVRSPYADQWQSIRLEAISGSTISVACARRND